MKEMLSNAEQIENWKKNLLRASNDLTWQKECETLDAIYSKYV
jgi:hypothetical protein